MQELREEKAYIPSLKKGLSFQEVYKALLADSERTEIQPEELCGCVWTFRCTDVMHYSHFVSAAPPSVSLHLFCQLQLILLPLFASLANPQLQCHDGACALLLRPGGHSSAHQVSCLSRRTFQFKPWNACAPGSSSKLGIIGQVLILTGQRRAQ